MRLDSKNENTKFCEKLSKVLSFLSRGKLFEQSLAYRIGLCMVVRQQESHERFQRTIELRTKEFLSCAGTSKKRKSHNHSGGGRKDAVVADGNSWIR